MGYVVNRWLTGEATPVGSNVSIPISSGTSTVSEAKLGTLDPTALANGDYLLTLYASSGGVYASTSESVLVNNRLKIGNFSLSFNDLTVPVAGTSVTLTRTYDSLNAETQGDFGYGWSLDLASIKLAATNLVNGGDGEGLGFQDGSDVYITLPGGNREKFEFDPQPWDEGSTLGYSYEVPGFTTTQLGVTDKLAVDSAYIQPDENGEYREVDGGDPYNPASAEFGGHYVLTTAQGVQYDFNGTTGTINSITDPAGNVLTVHGDGVTAIAPNGTVVAQIKFTRDADNRITAITDPAGHAIDYGYSASSGDLTSVTDRAGVRTTFAYTLSSRPHFLTDIQDDPSGNINLPAPFP